MVEVLNQDERVELLPLPQGPTELLRDPRDRQVLTLVRETDARTALTRGLAEYLSGLAIDMPGGRQVRFVQVLDVWADAELPARYPAALVYSLEQGEYDASKFTPQVVQVQAAEAGEGARVSALRVPSEFATNLMVETWSNDPAERMAISAMLEDAFDPTDWMSGFRLRLPHYHGAHATFEKLSSSYEDDVDEARRGWRRAIFVLRAMVPQIVAAGVMPIMRPRFIAEVSAP